MAATANINEILSQVKKLGKEDQLHLLERLIPLIRGSDHTKSTSLGLTSLSGLGSEIWKDTNIDKYVDDQRQW
jgi:hypothetical protein